MWFIGVEVEQETSAAPPKKNPGPPLQLRWQFFPNACLWRRSLCSNLAGLDSEKLYRATFICQYGLYCCMALVSFRLFSKNLGNLEEFFGQMDYRPPWQKIARTPMGVALAGYATLQLRPGRRLAKVPLKDPLPAWRRIFERQKSQNGRQPISKWQILVKTAELPREPCVPNF